MRRNVSKTLSLLLKVAFAAGVIYWMVHSGKLNLQVVGRAFTQQWPLAIFLLFTLYLQVAINSWRWNILNSAMGFGIRYLEAFSLSMIGLLFTVVIPGSVGGDVIKAYYVGTRVPNRRAHAFTTILLDRYLGLLSLLTLGAAGVCWNYQIILTNKVMTTLATFVILAFLGASLFLIAAVLFSTPVTSLLRRFVGRIPLVGQAVKCCEALEAFRAKPGVLVIGVLMSLPSHLIACLGMRVAMGMVGAAPMPLERFLLIVPLGLISTVIPLSPGGVGIGQAAFYGLCEALSRGSGQPASNAFTVFQTLQVGVYLSGFVSYLSHKPVKELPQAQEAQVVA
jgi:glycosyltransferase 2 family protein